ncbi:MAG: allophanate hydrolase [Proteobacteria bacterium]|nr:allophanate hydrolase [Pseudomonadota bacterium]
MPRPYPLTLADLRDAYRRGTWTPSAVVEHWLDRPAAEHGRPVWISTFDAPALRRRAAELDRELAHDTEAALRRPLFGALYAVKDNIDVAGLPTTAACPAFAYAPGAPAAVVARLDAAGAVCVGKTNLDQFATGLVGTRSPYGAVPNAFDATLVSGGSSSGSAVAVAQGLVHFSLGTDTAGSGRVPAGLNNIVGLKPTRGALSTTGVVPACRSLDCVSIFALTVADATRVFDVAAERPHAAVDAPSLAHAFRFAMPAARDLAFYGDAVAERAFAAAVARLRTLGGVPVEIDFAPWRAVASMLYEGAHVAERHAGIRAFFDAHEEDVEPTVRKIIADGRRYSATDVFVAEATLAAARARLAPLWSTFDVLVVPTAPTFYTLAAVAADPLETNRRLGTYTNFVNLLDLAALAVPTAMRTDGLPSGITLIAPAGHDRALATLGARVHADAGVPLGATGAPQPPSPAPQRTAADAGHVDVVVVGAHLSGLPLNRELVACGAELVRATRTAPTYRLYALPGTTPPKPGLVRVAEGGAPIDVEVWTMPVARLGAFVERVPSPLAIGTVQLDDGSSAHGFVCEAIAVVGAEDISRFGGWRRYLAERVPA